MHTMIQPVLIFSMLYFRDFTVYMKLILWHKGDKLTNDIQDTNDRNDVRTKNKRTR